MVQCNVTSVVLPQSLAPVRETYEVHLKSYQTKDLPIWTPDHIVPAAFDLSAPLELTVHAELTDYPAQNLTLHVSYIPSPSSPSNLQLVGSSAFDFSGENGTVQIRVSLAFVDEALKGIKTPWGIAGSLKWEIQTGADDARIAIGETPVELYALIPTLFKAFSSAGIPRTFLKLMVLPTLLHNVKTEADWINWTVNKCFRSSTQDGSIEELGDAMKPVHTYRYDIYYLQTYFSSALGADFQLDKWLSHHDSLEPWGVVNCYDQAGLVITTLSLGIPFERLRWQHIYAFGYLAAEGLPLIGWGKVNTTTGWKDDPTKKMRDQNDPGRKAFSNHSFASVEIDGEDKAVDACAGPVTGNLTLPDYVKTAIDHTTTLDTNPHNGHRPGTVDDLAKDKNDGRFGHPMHRDFPISKFAHDEWDTQRWAYKFWEMLWDNDKEVMRNIDALYRIKKLQPPEAGSAVDLNKLFGLLTQEVVEQFPAKSHGPVEVRSELTETKPLPGQTHISLGPGGAQAQWTYNGVRVIIRILPSPEIAKKVLLSRLYCSGNCHQIFKAPTDEEHKGCCHTVGVTDDSVEMWYYNNFVFEVFRMRDSPSDLKVKFVADKIHSYIQAGGPAISTTLDFKFEPPRVFEAPSSIAAHQEFDVKINVRGATFVTVDFEGDATLILKNKVFEGDDIYKYTFVAADTGSAKIVFTAFRKETCQTMVSKLEFQHIAS
ncbi:hypothetical protein BDN70DRAFT_877449 [Pholiota conissans]|uniref:Uncharacterized protein n=1 Tax=Pholiota conissans TaxID=109636 RepID=A0A9P6D1P4_9AGAR|nr:hypothetical protein BDN70DRAFT_877449 [Pholiota conissans]